MLTPIDWPLEREFTQDRFGMLLHLLTDYSRMYDNLSLDQLEAL